MNPLDDFFTSKVTVPSRRSYRFAHLGKKDRPERNYMTEEQLAKEVPSMAKKKGKKKNEKAQ